MKGNKSGRIMISFLFLGIAFLLSSFALAPAQEQKERDEDPRIVTMGGRALRDALRILEAQLGCTITYEDPKYKYPDTVQVLFPGDLAVPQTRIVSFSYNTMNTDKPVVVIQALLDRYQQADDTVKFKVVQSKTSSRIFNVSPVFEKNVHGDMTASGSLLDAKVSVSMTDTYAKILEEICKQVSLAPGGRRVMPSEPVTWNFREKKVSLKSVNVSALACLNALFHNYNSKEKDMISWSLAVDPRLDFAFVNLHRVAPSAKLLNLVSLRVESIRPFADGGKILEQQLKSVIVYEDPLYLCSCQVLKNRAGQPQSPVGGIFEFSYSATTLPVDVLTKAAEFFNKHNAGKFVVKQVGEVFFIHPTEFMNEKDQTLPLKPVLATSISLSANEKPASEILKTLCEKLAAETKQKVTLGKLPTSPAFTRALSYEAAQPAVKHLADLSKKLGGNVSWQLLYEPRLKGYTLNAHLIGN